MFFCGACRQEIELQEGIARPGHACKSPLHERPKHLHSATMCSAVHQPFEDGDDTSCGPACIVAFNAKIQADYDESLAWLEVDEEPRTRAGATLPKSPWMPSLSCGVSSRATDGTGPAHLMLGVWTPRLLGAQEPLRVSCPRVCIELRNQSSGYRTRFDIKQAFTSIYQPPPARRFLLVPEA